MPQLLALLGGLAFACCQWLIYVYAPEEATLGLIQKIFYIHLPLAWWALISFFTVFLGSIAYLLRRAPGADRLCAAAAEVGVLLSGLALVTGMLWARKSWGVWWTWDPRLTTTLIMWFVYAGYLVLRGQKGQIRAEADPDGGIGDDDPGEGIHTCPPRESSLRRLRRRVVGIGGQCVEAGA